MSKPVCRIFRSHLSPSDLDRSSNPLSRFFQWRNKISTVIQILVPIFFIFLVRNTRLAIDEGTYRPKFFRRSHQETDHRMKSSFAWF